MTNIIDFEKYILKQSITEIRVEEVRDVEFNYKPYWYIYYVLKNGKRIEIGKSLTRPQCYKQIAIYN
tara:strand:+ start:3215 stop:3415 length:201 start_codon:yes stop_codon:yes gene_type:complete